MPLPSLALDYDFSKAVPVVTDYFNYTNFSEFAIDSAMDQTVIDTAAELGYQAGLTISQMCLQVYDNALELPLAA